MASNSSGSATGNPRNKVALKPGHSLMDWIRLGNSGKDLTGVCGVPTTITRAQLAEHNTQDDAWLSIRGVVYNVTHYMDFHPGGCEELMRGVGKDATKLFNQVHAWVNYQSILQKCIVGQLGSSPEEDVFTIPSSPVNKSSSTGNGEVCVKFVKDGRRYTCLLSDIVDKTDQSLKVGDVRKVRWMDDCYYDATIDKVGSEKVSVTFLKDGIKYTCLLSDVKDYTVLKVGDKRPVRLKGQLYDAIIEKINVQQFNYYNEKMTWSQQSGSITFEFPSDCTIPEVQIFRSEPDCLRCKINSDAGLIKLNGKVLWPGHILIDPKTWHVKLKLSKEEEGLWKKYGTVENVTLCNLDYWQAEIISVDKETHDTCFIKMKYTKDVYNYIGVACHIFIKHTIEDEEVIRPYTPFPMLPITIPSPGNWSTTSETLNLMVKSYPSGIMGSWLCNLKSGNTLLISNPFGSFNTNVFSNITHVFLFAAGTGITPMISIIVWLLQTSRDKVICLKYFNKTVNDIMWRVKFDELMSENSRFSVEHIISDMKSDWTGKKGHVTLDLLREFLPTHSRDIPQTDYICICGPKPFTNDIETWLTEDLGYTSSNYFSFVGYK